MNYVLDSLQDNIKREKSGGDAEGPVENLRRI